jgi:hypothetical protein
MMKNKNSPKIKTGPHGSQDLIFFGDPKLTVHLKKPRLAWHGLTAKRGGDGSNCYAGMQRLLCSTKWLSVDLAQSLHCADTFSRGRLVVRASSSGREQSAMRDV